jgi:hypothetical protein
LVCVTDLTQCCRVDDTPGVGGPLGEWFYPSGSLVRVQGGARGDDFYRSRGLGIVHLNRINNTMSPTGQFCCVIPDATSTIKNTCINIGEQIDYLTTINNYCDQEKLCSIGLTYSYY